MGDLISDRNEFIVKSNYKLRELNISPLDIFRLISVIDVLPFEWRESLNTFVSTADEPFNLQNEIKLSFNGKNVLIETVVSQTIIKNFEIESSLHRLPNLILIPILLMMFQIGKRFTACHFVLPWTPAQNHVNSSINYLTGCLVTNSFLYKIGVIPSPACSFCGEI